MAAPLPIRYYWVPVGPSSEERANIIPLDNLVLRPMTFCKHNNEVIAAWSDGIGPLPSDVHVVMIRHGQSRGPVGEGVLIGTRAPAQDALAIVERTAFLASLAQVAWKANEDMMVPSSFSHPIHKTMERVADRAGISVSSVALAAALRLKIPPRDGKTLVAINSLLPTGVRNQIDIQAMAELMGATSCSDDDDVFQILSSKILPGMARLSGLVMDPGLHQLPDVPAHQTFVYKWGNYAFHRAGFLRDRIQSLREDPDEREKVRQRAAELNCMVLMSAMLNMDPGDMQFLLDLGGKPVPRTLLIISQYEACGPNIARLLIETGHCSLQQRTRLQRTPLMIAALSGHLEMVKYLREQGGTDVNDRDVCGRTALMLASYYGRLEVVIDLVEQGHADHTLRDKDGKTALQLAEERHWFPCVDTLKVSNIIY